MPPRLKVRAGLALLCLLTLGLKGASIAAAVPQTDLAGRERLAGFLAAQGYAEAEVPPMAGIGMVGGARGTCRLVLAGMSLQGYQDDILGQVKSPGDAVSFVMGGAVHAEPPRWRARLAYYGDKVRRGMGLPTSGETLTGVIASPGCPPDAADWSLL